MRKPIAAAIIIAASAAVTACGHDRGEDAGPMVSRNYAIGNFQEIEVAGPYEVEIRTGGAASAKAEGSEKLLAKTRVEVKDGKLMIGPDGDHGTFHFGWSTRGKAKFVVTVPQLSGATIAGSGDIQVDKVQGDGFQGAVAGSGDIDIHQIQVQSLKLSIAGSGSVKAASGTAQGGKFDIAGSGDLDLSNVDTKEMQISIAGSGDLQAHSTGSAQITIMGSGNATISGGAKCQVTKMGSGEARCS